MKPGSPLRSILTVFAQIVHAIVSSASLAYARRCLMDGALRDAAADNLASAFCVQRPVSMHVRHTRLMAAVSRYRHPQPGRRWHANVASLSILTATMNSLTARRSFPSRHVAKAPALIG